MSSLGKSIEYHKSAVKSIPLGVNSNFRYWGPEDTRYISHGKGAYIWDVDDNRYIDYRLGYGPVILGHADDRVTFVVDADAAIDPGQRARAVGEDDQPALHLVLRAGCAVEHL